MEAVEEGGGGVELPAGCPEGHGPVGQDVLGVHNGTGRFAGVEVWLGKLLHLGDGRGTDEGVRWPGGGGGG